MSSWAHFLAGPRLVASPQRNRLSPQAQHQEQSKQQFEEVQIQHSPIILRTFSSSPLQSHLMSRNDDMTPMETSSLGEPPYQSTSEAGVVTRIPRRNLAEAFDELYIERKLDTPMINKTVSAEQETVSMISPTGVVDFEQKRTPLDKCTSGSHTEHDTEMTVDALTKNMKYTEKGVPHFVLHADLQRDLTDALVNRVSFYAIIHDINKEASAMASHDDSGYNGGRNPEEMQEEYDPLIVAVKGQPKESLVVNESSLSKLALIDEERWLLDTIDSRSSYEARVVDVCPPTFLQAMGEKDYENPLNSLSGASRTQLWKPSRSWWEAKSGKNPWIEPKSHNKRWRYLWPLIHYHKFLAKCIKKLKRNGVDVKISVSPVSAFLREEVCAVSDHLAAVSLFDSDQWMECLEHFNGWTNTSPEAETCLREKVAALTLRPLLEPGDIDSPLLRSQIDEQYLRAMAAARAQLADGATEPTRKASTHNGSGLETKTKKNNAMARSDGPPPAYPRANMASPPSHASSGKANSGPSPYNLRRPRWGYAPHPQNWYLGGWHPSMAYSQNVVDDNSVQSGLSGDSFAYDPNLYPGGMPHPHYYHPMMYPHHYPPHPGFDPTFHGSNFGRDGYCYEQFEGSSLSTAGIPNVPPPGMAAPEASTPPQVVTQTGGPDNSVAASESNDAPTPKERVNAEHTPYKYNPGSPYWGHLDQATLAMMGIATPQHGMASPQTPSREQTISREGSSNEHAKDSATVQVNAQPLLLQQQQYTAYGYYGNGEACIPPSPATQFMMSPQANFGYAYGAYTGFSPNRMGAEGCSSPSVAHYDSHMEYKQDELSSVATTPSKPNSTTTET